MKNLPAQPPITDAVSSLGKMTSALWSCELHRELCFAAADATVALPAPANKKPSRVRVAQGPRDGRFAIPILIAGEV